MTTDIPQEFLMIYQSIENEVVDLSFKISFDERQKGVFSPFIGELELRIYSLIESVAKFKGSELQNQKYDEFFGKFYQNKKNKPKVLVTMSAYGLDKKDYSDVFDKIEKRVIMIDKDGALILDPKNRSNWKYNNAYQNLRHNFIDSLPVYGTIEYLFESLAVLFLVMDRNNSQIFSTYEFTEDGKKSYWLSSGIGMSIRKAE